MRTQATIKPFCRPLRDVESHVRVKLINSFGKCTLLEDFRNKKNEYLF